MGISGRHPTGCQRGEDCLVLFVVDPKQMSGQVLPASVVAGHSGLLSIDDASRILSHSGLQFLFTRWAIRLRRELSCESFQY